MDGLLLSMCVDKKMVPFLEFTGYQVHSSSALWCIKSDRDDEEGGGGVESTPAWYAACCGGYQRC